MAKITPNQAGGMGRKKGARHGEKRHKVELFDEAFLLLETLIGLTHEDKIECLSRVFATAARPEIVQRAHDKIAELKPLVGPGPAEAGPGEGSGDQEPTS